MAKKYFQFVWVTTLERSNQRALLVTTLQRCNGFGSGFFSLQRSSVVTVLVLASSRYNAPAL